MIKKFTVLMPCLNEEKTIGSCIEAAIRSMDSNHVLYDILISDNGSSDSSVKIAESLGASVVYEERKGYGSALLRGIENATGDYIIMGDCDMSYDFSRLELFVWELLNGYDLVMGDRFGGGILTGAMPWSHRYIGNPLLSMIGRRISHSSVRDFCCGLRGFDKERIKALGLSCTGMEFAVEMVVQASLHKYKIKNVPIVLHPDGRDRPPHLRTIKDGIRMANYYRSVI